MAWWWLPVLVAAGWPALNFAIQRGLTAPRVAETTDPGALPWEVVHLPTANEKRLFGWFIPATPGAPALVVMHGWGGNAEMMLPLAAPLHAAGYSLLLVDARCHGSPSAGSARPTIPSGQSSRAPGPAASAAHAPARRILGRLRTDQELPDSSSL